MLFRSEVVELHPVEVVAPFVDEDVPPPIVIHALVDEDAPGLGVLQFVRPTRERRLDGGLRDIAVFPVVFGQYPEPAHGKREGRIQLDTGLHDEADFALVDCEHVVQVAQRRTQRNRAVAQEGLVGEHHIFGGDRLPVVEARFRAQAKCDPGKLRADHDPVRETAVVRHRLINGRLDQSVVDKAPANIEPGSAADGARRVALSVVGIDAEGNEVSGLFDGDLDVDLDDFFLFADAFGTNSADAVFDARFDLDGDGAVRLSDFFLFADNFGVVAVRR